MVGHFYAMRGAFLQQWRVTASVRELVLISIFQTPLAIGHGWVARSSDEPAVVATVAIGAGLMILWSMAVFYTGFAMVDELFGGTLELNMLSRTRSASSLLARRIRDARPTPPSRRRASLSPSWASTPCRPSSVGWAPG